MSETEKAAAEGAKGAEGADMSEESLKGLFEASMAAGGKDKIGFSDEESGKFQKAFSDPEFRKMFADYMDELQDPAHREETENYISQLEGEQKVPPGKELIRPAPGFVAKTYKEDKAGKDSKGDKIWINIVASDKITKPSMAPGPGGKGESWSLPYSLGPPHMEKDNSESNVSTFDCCYHPEALEKAKQRKQFQSMLVQTAIDGVESAYAKQNQPTTLLKSNFHILKGVSYKSGIISAMMVDKKDKEAWEDEQNAKNLGKVEELAGLVSGKKFEKSEKPAPGKPRSKEEIEKAVNEARAKQAATADATSSSTGIANANTKTKPPPIKKGFLEGRGGSAPKTKSKVPQGQEQGQSPTPRPLVQEISSTVAKPPKPPSANQEKEKVQKQEVEKDKPMMSAASTSYKKGHTERPVDASLLNTLEKEKSSGPIEPSYTIVERGFIEWGDFELNSTNADGTGGETPVAPVKNTRPKELVVKIELPRVPTGQAGKVVLDVSEKKLSLKFKEVYDLNLVLPYPVDDKRGGAKFEKLTQSLVVTLPTKRPDTPVIPVRKPPNAVHVIEDKDKEGEVKSTKKETPKDKKTTSNPYVKGLTEDEKKNGESLKEELARGVKAAKEQAELEAKNPKPKKVVEKKEPSPSKAKKYVAFADSSEESFDPSVTFMAAKTFTGSKNGYYFGTGAKGIGYYLDTSVAKINDTGEATKTKEAYVSTPTFVEARASTSVPTDKIPKYDYKQTLVAVSLLVQVSAVDKESIKVEFESIRARCSFRAMKPEYAKGQVESKSNANERGGSDADMYEQYSFELTLNDASNKLSFDATKCTYDVASRNVVFVLMKSASAPGIWADDKKDLIGCRPTARLESENTGSGNGSGSTKGTGSVAAKTDKKEEVPEGAVDELVKQAQAMSFSSSSALFDLD